MKHARLSEVIEEYLAHLAARGLEPRTVRTHQSPLRKALLAWGDVYISSIRPAYIDKFFTVYDYAPKTRNLYLGNLRMFFAYCRKHQYLPKDFDPTDTWRPVKVPKGDPPRISIEQFVPVLEAATDPRDRAVIALGLFTFCRASEIQTMRVKDLDFDANTLDIYRHKTKEADVLPLASELKVEMVRWLNFYESQQGTLQGDWFLVPAKGPLPMHHDSLRGRLAPTGEPAQLRPDRQMSHPYRAAQRPLRAIGVKERGTGGHVLRRSGARALFDRLRGEGYDGALMRVSSMLGHANTRNTELYLGLSVERTQRNELLAGKPMFPDLTLPSEVATLRAM